MRKMRIGVSIAHLPTILLLVLASSFSFAQSQPTILEVATLEELIQLSRSNNPDLKSYELNVAKNSFDVKATKAIYLPAVAGNFAGQKNFELATTPIPGEIFGQPGTFTDVQFGQNYAYNAGISLNQTLLDRGSTLKVKLAKLSYETAESQKSAYLQFLDQQVSLNYYSLLISKRAIALAAQDLEVSDSIVHLSEQKFEEGLLDALAVNQAKINSNVTRQNLNSSQQLYNKSRDELKLLLGMGQEDSLNITTEIPDELPSMVASDEMSPNENINLASLQKQQAQAQVSIQKSLFVPKLSLNGYYGFQQFRDDFGVSFGNNAWTTYSYLGLNLSIPIFTGLSSQNKLRASKVELERAENEWNKVNLESQSQDARLIEEYHTSLRNSQLALDAFRLYEKNEQLTLQKYSEGLISLDRYLYSFEDYLKAENAYLNSLLTTYSYYSQIISRTN
jgi:outer membrane protein TolC